MIDLFINQWCRFIGKQGSRKQCTLKYVDKNTSFLRNIQKTSLLNQATQSLWPEHFRPIDGAANIYYDDLLSIYWAIWWHFLLLISIYRNTHQNIQDNINWYIDIYKALNIDNKEVKYDSESKGNIHFTGDPMVKIPGIPKVYYYKNKTTTYNIRKLLKNEYMA